MAACYKQNGCDSMSRARSNVWASKTGKGTPKLCTFPPTNESFFENVERAHLQAAIWLSVKHQPPDIDPEEFGWKKNETDKSLIPVTLPDNTTLAPESVFRLIKCGCASETSCSSSKCGCNSSKLPCTMFCACHAGVCFNTQN